MHSWYSNITKWGKTHNLLAHNKLDRWWSSVGASLSCVVGSMLSERVGSMHARMHYVCVKSCPECSVHMLYLCRKCEKGLVWIKWLARKTDICETQEFMATLTRKRKYEEVRWSLSHSSLAVRCAGISAFRFPIIDVLSLVATYHDYTLHCSHERGMAAPRGSVGTCNISVSHEWDGHGRSVGRLVDARGPIDHASVGLT